VAQYRKPLDMQIGDKIAVIGHPLHGLVAINVDIRRGNSGGPVVDDRGYVVGVVSAKINTPAMFKRTGQVMGNIGLIIRQDRALRFLDRFNVVYTGGDLRHPMNDKALFDLAHLFVARIGCWG
jgi:hypothetical protein